MKADAAGLTEVKPLVKYQLATISRAQESTYDKNINRGKSAKVLYIPAGLIEIHPQMIYQLAIINRS